jgi:hypothetical protein
MAQHEKTEAQARDTVRATNSEEVTMIGSSQITDFSSIIGII